MLYTFGMPEQIAADDGRSGRDRALDYLRDVVLADPAVEGTYVNEGRIAQAVGVSRTPVREALLVLASEGLVQLQPRRGAYVPPLTAREIRELMDLRGLIERHAAQRVLEGDRSPHEAMEAVLAEQEDIAATTGDRAAAHAFIRLDRDFHQLLVDAAGSRLLARTYAGLRERQVRVGVAALDGRPRWGEVCTEHRAITEALRGGDPEAARRAVDDHLELTLRSLLES